MLSDPANVFTPSADHILLPLSLPKALGEDLPTISPPACSAAEVDMSAFDENMPPSSSSLSSILKRGRDSPAKGRIDGTKVRILSVRKGAFLLFSMGAPEAFFYRGVRKMQISPLVTPWSIRFFGAWCWGGRRPVFCACADFLWTELILNCFSGPLFPRWYRHCASTLPTQNATQPSSAFCCTLGWWWVGCYGAVCAHGGHLERGRGREGAQKAVCTWIWGNEPDV